MILFYCFLLGLVYFAIAFSKSALGWRRGRKVARKISLEDKVLGSEESFHGEKIDLFDPRNGNFLKSEFCATKEDVIDCVRRASIAQEKWANTSFEERRTFLCDLIETIIKNKDDICIASMTDTGKTLIEAELGEIMTTLEKIRYTINFGEEALKPSYRRVPLALLHRNARVEYFPLGIIGAIIPWNYPAHSSLSPIVTALFAGNSIVVKVSEHSLYSRVYLQSLVRNVLTQRGHSPDLVHLIPGYGETGAALCQAQGISKILFIGSPQTGKKIMETCSKQLVPVTLELGGKDPFIILEDAELEWAAQVAIRGAFINCGQNCIASERIFVYKPLHDKFTELIINILKKTVQGEGICDWGCMSTRSQFEKVKELVRDAIENGAKVLYGGHENPSYPNGLFFEPTVITNVSDKMRILHEETFGPVILINVFESEDDLIKKVNNSDYGLCASIFSQNKTKAEAMLKKIESGMGVVNDFGLPYLIQDAPFGGTKMSGFGKFNGPEGLREFSRAQVILGERFWTPRTIKGPRLVSYPIPHITPQAIDCAIDIFYGWGFKTKIYALINLLKILLTEKNTNKND